MVDTITPSAADLKIVSDLFPECSQCEGSGARHLTLEPCRECGGGGIMVPEELDVAQAIAKVRLEERKRLS